MRGAVNATAPGAERHEDVIAQLAKRRRVRLSISVPAGLLRRLLGELSELFIGGTRVWPLEAQAMGFEFKFATLNRALDDLVPDAAEETAAEVFYDGACPICSAEITAYVSADQNNGGRLMFTNLAEAPARCAVNALDREVARRRLYVRLANNKVVSGVDAFIAIWRGLPDYRWLARVINWPLVRPLCIAFYDFIAAPLVSTWSRYRRTNLRLQHNRLK